MLLGFCFIDNLLKNNISQKSLHLKTRVPRAFSVSLPPAQSAEPLPVPTKYYGLGLTLLGKPFPLLCLASEEELMLQNPAQMV